MSDFTHLHVHSHYSLLDGLGKIENLIQRTKELGMKSIALTDHGVMYGVIDFYRTAHSAGIKPIIGLEAYLAPKGHTNKRGKIDTNPRHVTLLAKNNTGYQNLIQLTSIAHLDGYYYKPRIDYDLLAKYHAGLIVLSGCLNSDIAKAILSRQDDKIKQIIQWHANVFGPDHFFLEVQHHPNIKEQTIVNEAILKLARQYKIPAVATCDVHYIHPNDAEAQDVLVCVQTGKTVQDKDRLCMLGENFSLTSPAEMIKAWPNNPEVITNTQRVANMCHLNLKFGVNKLPHYPLPKKETADSLLQKKCQTKLKQVYQKNNRAKAQARLNYELAVIQKTGFASYFLIVADFVNEAKRRGILVGPGRGSAAGSIVSYLTNITGLDPLRYNLLFERFLNPARVSMPDIDLDFADDRRDEVIDYVRKKYGRDHVAQIITFGTMAARAAVRDTGRALGLPYSFCDTVAKAIPLFATFNEALNSNTELKTMYDNDPQVKRLVDTAKKLEGVCRHASTHAAGVVITEQPLTKYIPLQLANSGHGRQRQIITQYAMNHIEKLGLLKMDFLGLKNLTIIKNTLAYTKESATTTIDLNHLPLDNNRAYQLLQAGRTTGVFQLESPGMKRYLKELKPSEFEDIVSMVALYRPGPIDSIPDFIKSKHGQRKIQYLHPLLKPILEKTYGVIVTQDQVLEIARQFAGFSYAEADILRKAVGKKIRKLLVEQREKFIRGAIENKKIAPATAQAVWHFIEPFASYGFNRAHAVCYAMIAYQTAYLKANWPAEFMAALLTSDEGNTDRQAIEVAEAISLGIKVLPPDINQSKHDFTVNQKDNVKNIRFGLGAIKNVGHGVITAIIQERDKAGPYQDVFDLFRRMDCKDFNRKSVESLTRAGALDSICERNQVLMNIDKLLEFNKKLHRPSDAGQQGLFSQESTALTEPTVTLEAVSPASKDDYLAWEKELLGLYLSEHPLQDWQPKLKDKVTPLHDIRSTHAVGSQIYLAGVVTKINKITTKSGQFMLFVQMEDLTSKIEVLVFPALLEQSKDLWTDTARLLVKGKLSNKDEEPKFLADKVWLLNDENLSKIPSLSALKPRTLAATTTPTSVSSLAIQLPAHLSQAKLENLKRELSRLSTTNNQGLKVELIIPHQDTIRTITTRYRIIFDQANLASLERIVGPGSLRYQ